MLKARLVPLYFEPGRDVDFDKQLKALRKLLADEAEFLDPVALGGAIPEAEAVVFPQLLGEAYRQLEAFKKMRIPILIITSEFGTVSMWDWEIATYLKGEGVSTIAPYNIEQTRVLCTSLGVKRELEQAKFLVFQDDPGEGMQASIFKRFYWWEDQCTRSLQDKFGVSIERRSFKALAEEARVIGDAEAEGVLMRWGLKGEGLSAQAMGSAVKMYLALKREVEKDKSIRGVGINCLNESRFSDTTPCLAWSKLYEETGILWACEADTLSLATKYILHHSLNAQIMMTNVYPFLLGMAALKHEKISNFPEIVDQPDNHVLLAHCGYLGVVPESFCQTWALRPRVLGIVNENAHAIDARLATGDATLAKLDPKLKKILVVEGGLKGYVQYPGSDCRNGAVVKVSDGHQLMDTLYSHHLCLMPGHWGRDIQLVAKVFNLEVEEV